MARALTDAEWNAVHGWYPDNLARNDCTWTAAPTRVYNCIGYALGYTNQWINPPASQIVFTLFYERHNLRECPFADPQATQDGYANNGRMVHGSRLRGRWESKQGPSFRMFHPRAGLTGLNSGYGFIVVTYKLDNSLGNTLQLMPIAVSASEEARRRIAELAASLGAAYSYLDNDFEARFTKWKDTWFLGDLANAQSSTDRAQGPEWNNLVQMGPSVLPQVVNKLRDDDNNFAIELYNKLQSDPNKKVNPSDLDNYYILSNHVQWILKHYAAFINVFNAQVGAWEVDQEATGNSSLSDDYLNCDSYRALVNMGTNALPLVMEQYAREQDGWWHEFLFEVVNGRPSGARGFYKPDLYQYWKQWFEKGGNMGTADPPYTIGAP